jgi:hypothetical protein
MMPMCVIQVAQTRADIARERGLGLGISAALY